LANSGHTNVASVFSFTHLVKALGAIRDDFLLAKNILPSAGAVRQQAQHLRRLVRRFRRQAPVKSSRWSLGMKYLPSVYESGLQVARCRPRMMSRTGTRDPRLAACRNGELYGESGNDRHYRDIRRHPGKRVEGLHTIYGWFPGRGQSVFRGLLAAAMVATFFTFVAFRATRIRGFWVGDVLFVTCVIEGCALNYRP
jgi:hypothetical protein